VPKDRAAPFSRKHRRYWFTVTGGMIFIGLINVAIGMCSYTPDHPVQEIIPVLPVHDASIDATGTLGASELPAPVMRAFAVKYPRTIPAGVVTTTGDGGTTYVIAFPPGGTVHHATFRADGTFVAAD